MANVAALSREVVRDQEKIGTLSGMLESARHSLRRMREDKTVEEKLAKTAERGMKLGAKLSGSILFMAVERRIAGVGSAIIKQAIGGDLGQQVSRGGSLFMVAAGIYMAAKKSGNPLAVMNAAHLLSLGEGGLTEDLAQFDKSIAARVMGALPGQHPAAGK